MVLYLYYMKINTLLICSFFFSFIGFSQVQIGNDINGLNTNDAFGWSVAVSGDGQTIVAGAPNSFINGDSSGQVQVYQFDGMNWMQLGNSLNAFAESDNAGRSVDITEDGTTIVIGLLGYSLA